MSNPVRVLVIDDDEAILRSQERVLRAMGYVVQTALGGRAGLAAMITGEHDAILCDVTMPEVGGADVFVAAQHGKRADRIVFWSGDWPAALAALLDAEGVPRLDKPCLPAQLRAVIERLARPR